VRAVFMGTPEFAVPSLTRLIDGGYDVVAVYTQPDRRAGRGRMTVMPPVKEAALRLGLPVLQPESFRSDDITTQLAEYKPDFIVVCAYGQILTTAVLGIPSYQCINIHFSLLPRHRGASPVAAAILAGDEFTGVSLQLVRKKLDTGPLLIAGAVPVMPWDTAGSLTGKLSRVAPGLLLEALSGWLRGEREPWPQDEARATYFRQIRKEEGEIDWNLPAVEIWRRVRAFYPWPGCYTTWRGKQFKITGAVALPEGELAQAGKVLCVSPDNAGPVIATGAGTLVVSRVQMEGRREMSAAEFLKGQRDFIGTVLPN
jgi:methionyl-tRNA formyltransferase